MSYWAPDSVYPLGPILGPMAMKAPCSGMGGLGCAGCREKSQCPLDQNYVDHMDRLGLGGLGADASQGAEGESVFVGGSGTPTYDPSTGISPGVNWGNILTQGAGTGFSILRDMFGGPRPGTYVSTGPGGQSVVYRMPTDGQGFSLPNIGSPNTGSLLVWGAVILGGVLLVKSMSK